MGFLKLLRDTLIILIITFTILGVMEFALRIAFPDKTIDDNVPLSDLAYEHNDTFLISLKPNVKKEFNVNEVNGGGIVTWQTNSFCFRGGELKDKSEPRIIVYGDSNVQARFTQDENTYPAVLQSLLGNSHSNVEVINAGLVGAGPDQNLIRLSSDIDKVSPDIVIFHVFADNDYGDIIRNRMYELSSNGQLARTAYPITKDQQITSRETTVTNWIKSLLLVKAVFKLVSSEIDIESLEKHEKTKKVIGDLEQQSEIEYSIYMQNEPRQISHFADHYDIDIATNPDSDSAKLKIKLMEQVLLEANALAQSRQAIFLVVIQPSVYDLTLNVSAIGHKDLKTYKNYNKYNLTKPLKDICSRNALNCVHLVDFYENNEPESLYRKNDNHWNDKGQRIAAKATAEKINELLN